MGDIKIRPAVISELPILREFEQGIIATERPFNECLKPEGIHYYDLGALIESDKSIVMVAEDAGQIIASGYARIRESKPHLIHDFHIYLGFMYVVESHRGQGINQLIMEALVLWGKKLGFEDFYLEAYADNRPALTAYEKMGFKPSLIEMKLS
ncbi:N-acetyltransferase family protein [Paraglaciecola sp. 2405UD69-4]|uniref:GNAT family N-acetyltransferase n=1 Tax=Paraglaciecola sp. 2405UD69-4 TaxID=3391836 RepID=UPI0039C9001F